MSDMTTWQTMMIDDGHDNLIVSPTYLVCVVPQEDVTRTTTCSLEGGGYAELDLIATRL